MYNIVSAAHKTAGAEQQAIQKLCLKVTANLSDSIELLHTGLKGWKISCNIVFICKLKHENIFWKYAVVSVFSSL